MKNSKKIFILTEAVLAGLLVLVAFLMLWEKTERSRTGLRLSFRIPAPAGGLRSNTGFGKLPRTPEWSLLW